MFYILFVSSPIFSAVLFRRMDDPQATYEFPSHFNSSYKGGFKDGMFQGEGKLYFPELGMIYSGKFDKGVSTEGALEFTDGLLCDDPWTYCDGNQNRMFKSEMEKGMKPAGCSQLTNQDPPRSIPDGMYDCSDGFYDPQKRTILDYNLAFLRNADEVEHNWITNNCRKAWDEPVGIKKVDCNTSHSCESLKIN